MRELLAPVGNITMLKAAIDAGADAVFLAGPYFGARSKSANFNLDEIVDAIKTAHLYDVKVFVTVNTLIKDSELSACYEYIDFLYINDVDALIVQDLAVIDYAQTNYPDLSLHGSTQMAITTLDGVEFAKKLGLCRVVIARETPLETIKKMIQVPEIECEVFIHGALCYAYSGLCLLSSAFGGRSGNRGQCAQPCRLNYEIGDLGNYYALSMKDLSTINHFDELKNLNIASFKIEGRLRHPDYVYHTVKAYRLALNGANTAEIESQISNMERSFSRDYTKGHLFAATDALILNNSANKGERIGTVTASQQFKLTLKLEKPILIGDGLKVMQSEDGKGIEVFNLYKNGDKVNQTSVHEEITIDFNGLVPLGTPVYRTRSQELTKIRERVENSKTIPIKMSLQAKVGQIPSLCVQDNQFSVTVYGEVPLETSKTMVISVESLKENLEKLGGTAFHLDQFEAYFDATSFVPKSLLNGLRRDAIHKLSELRSKRFPQRKHIKSIKPSINSKESAAVKLHIYVHTLEQAELALQVEDAMVFSPNREILNAFNLRIHPYLDPVKIKSGDTTASTHLSLSNLGQLMQVSTGDVIWGVGTQIMNTHAYHKLKSYGVSDVLLSLELTTQESETLIDVGARIFVYGKIPVMYTKTCSKKQVKGSCKGCNHQLSLVSKREGIEELFALCDGELLTIYTKLPLIRNSVWIKNKPIPLCVWFVDETIDEMSTVLNAIIAKELVSIASLDSYKKPIF